MAGSFELKKAKNGQFHFNLKAGNGEIILTSEMYVAKKSAQAGIASVKLNSRKKTRFEKADSANGKFYFKLKAGNHQVIGNSQMYATAASRDAGIASVNASGPGGAIKDNT